MQLVESLIFILETHAIPADCMDICLHLNNVRDGIISNDTERYLKERLDIIHVLRKEHLRSVVAVISSPVGRIHLSIRLYA